MKFAKLSAMSVAGLIFFSLFSLVAAPAQASQSFPARFSGQMYIVDHDSPDANDTGTRTFGPISEQDLPFIRGGCVDEVRGWVRVDAVDGAPGGWLQVRIEGRLYEGNNCATTDLDGMGVRFVWLPPNATTTHTFRVKNTDEGDDYIDYKLVMQN